MREGGAKMLDEPIRNYSRAAEQDLRVLCDDAAAGSADQVGQIVGRVHDTVWPARIDPRARLGDDLEQGLAVQPDVASPDPERLGQAQFRRKDRGKRLPVRRLDVDDLNGLPLADPVTGAGRDLRSGHEE